VVEAGEYGQFEIELGLGSFRRELDADAVLCLLAEEFFLPGQFNGMAVEDVIGHAEGRLAELRGLLGTAANHTSATFVLHTVPLSRTVRDCFISVRDRAALTSAWHRLNADLLALTAEDRQVITIDLVGVLTQQPIRARDNRLHLYADMPYTDAALLILAQETRRVLQARAGLSRKVLALDADNTLWGGVLGEVGMHGVELGGLYPGNAYTGLQRAAAALRGQGVLLVLASKNDADLVTGILSEHPEVRLRPEAFSVLAANWTSKAENLRAAARSLGLSTSSFVFMDDSPYERGHVRAEVPEVAVLAADGDPSHLAETLLSGGWFDVLDLTEADHKRPDLYRVRALRNEYSAAFSSSEDYLRALGICLIPAEATPFSIPRIAQLSARSNQFNLTGIRFDEATTAEMSHAPDYLVASFSMTDRFGAEGIIGAAWVRQHAEEWRVLNLVMSCRVLGRGVELAIAQWLFDRAAAACVRRMRADFVPSLKNSVAADTWERAGLLPEPEAPDGTRSYARELGELPRVAPDWITFADPEEQI
jgi:FkbH-like protein